MIGESVPLAPIFQHIHSPAHFDENGLTSFNLLQHHCSQASAIRYYLFDLLSDRGKRWLDVSLADRRAALSLKFRLRLRLPLLISETIEAPSAKLIQSINAFHFIATTVSARW